MPWPLGAAAFAAYLAAGMAVYLVPTLLVPTAAAYPWVPAIPFAWIVGWILAARLWPQDTPALALGLGATMAGALAYLADHGVAAFLVAMALHGAGAGLLVPAARRHASGLPPERHDLLFGRLIALGGAGLLAGLPLAAVLGRQNLHLPPLVTAALAAVALAATLLRPMDAGEPGVVAGPTDHDHGKDG